MNQDRELETYLQGKSPLSQAYADLPEVGLPDHLDAAILAEAHRAVGARPGVRPKRRWAIPLGMVASLFAVVMIGLQLPQMMKDAALSEPNVEAKIAAALNERAPMPDTAAPSTPTPSTLAPDRRQKLSSMDSAKSERIRAEPAPMAAEAEAKPNAQLFAAPAAQTPAEYDRLGASSAQPPVPAAAPAMAARAAKRMAVEERSEIADETVLSKEKKSSGFAEGMLSDAPAPAAAPAPQPAQRARALIQDESRSADLPPKEWLARITTLKQAGKLEEAKKELAAFKQRYPDYPVPKDVEPLRGDGVQLNLPE